ncbi:hypothetical protein J1N35_044690 [Gossypium stocksii]|uniref:RNase H type-1 domain-containing protein n=1 Tax=Gossypium stocksii TaxID=47602 RepID=A0A9D3U9I3_9ROSI|nr:hypothetical protein J1N35_044690 [Gossypium stocksii]
MSAQGLLEKGIGWHIGDGSVNICNDPWIPRPGDGQIRSEDQAQAILSIPLARTKLPNSSIWRLDESGVYTVKSGYLAEIEALEIVRYPRCSSTQIHWRPPDLDFIKVNFDSSFNLQEKTSISGIIARNERGLIMGAYTYPHINIADAFVAEARAYEQAIQFAQDIGFRRVQIEGDSLTIIKKLHANTNDRSVLSLILADIRQRLGFFEQINFHHVKREANNAFIPWPRRGAEILRVDSRSRKPQR